jgi:hypothetical protein
MTPNSNITGGTKKQSTENSKKTEKNRESGKPKNDLFENRPVGFRFIENRWVSVSVSVSRRALVFTKCIHSSQSRVVANHYCCKKSGAKLNRFL